MAPTTREWALQVLDVRSGQVVQRIELSPASAQAHRIEDVDRRHLLWSRGDRVLSAHAMRSG